MNILIGMRYIFLIVLFSASLFPQKRNSEFRSTWVITWEYISSSSSVETNKARIRQVLDDHKAANMTSVLWQVRQGGTAYYQSSYEPWGSYAGGSYPGFDPLAYAVEEAHKRGLEIHAWFNVFAASSTANGAPAQQHPEWICRDNAGNAMTSSIALSPGMAAVRDYTLKVAAEVVRKYDIDGFHLDYIRWNEYSSSAASKAIAKQQEQDGGLDGRITPELINDIENNQAGRYLYDVEHPYSAGVPTGFSTWEDWWRWSVTEFVRKLHDSIQVIKPWVRLSCAALGKYNWTSWQGYGYVYQDAALWFNNGYIDQLTPMHYHWTTGGGFFGMLAGACPSCWSQSITTGIAAKRMFTVGPGSYILDENNVWYKHQEIVDTCRSVPWTDGYQFFSYGTWKNYAYWNTAAQTFFKKKTKIRAAKFMRDTIPAAPALALQKLDSLRYRVSVTPPAGTPLNQWYILYRSKTGTVHTDSSEIVDVRFEDSLYTVTETFTGLQDFNGRYRYAVTRADRWWNESALSNQELTDPIPSFPPRVTATVPANNDSCEAAAPVKITFSKGMRTASLQTALRFTPDIPVSSLTWSADLKTVTVNHTQNFVFGTVYKLKIDSTASDVNGTMLDGNGDGIPGDSYSFSFKVVSQDITPPSVTAVIPDTSASSALLDAESPVTLVFNELLNTSTVTTASLILKKNDAAVSADFRITPMNGKSVIALKPQGGFIPASVYQLRLTTAIKDLNNNALANDIVFTFRTSSLQYSLKKNIDDFSVDGGYWMTPSYSGSTVGIVDSGTAWGFSTSYYMPASAPSKAAYLQYQWDPVATSKLIREYLNSGAPRDVTFDTSYYLQAFVYGDGSGNKFRFAIDEGNGTSWPNHEVSVWFPIDWTGWKLVEWQLNDPSMVGAWIGNGALDMPLYRVDSFQMTDATGSAKSGRIYIDEFRIVKKSPAPSSAAEGGAVLAGFALEQNYPNPFNAATVISFHIPPTENGSICSVVIYDVTGRAVKTLVNNPLAAGGYAYRWDGTNSTGTPLPSGIYLYRVTAGTQTLNGKMTMVK